MPLSVSRSSRPCVIALPTLVVAGQPELGRHVTDLLAHLGIQDVDVAVDYVEAHRRAVERDYSAIVLAGRPARSFGFQRFCASFGGDGGDPPGVILISDGPVEALPCFELRPFRLEPDFDAHDLRRAVWTAVGQAGQSCKSAGLCQQPSCSLDPKRRAAH
jgi:hypothetical protein